MSILALSRIATTNLGDLVSSPCLYFDYGATYHDTKLPIPPEADVYIFGGGAITRDMTIQQGYVEGTKIAWGIGQTNRFETETKPFELPEFSLIGSRDTGQVGAEWVPCASCMSPLFDKEYEIEHDVVTYLNSRSKDLSGLGINVLTNRCTFEEAIRFIGSAKVCVTTSYHGAYWATLLGRAAVIVNPYSSKFYNYKHQPVVVEPRKRLDEPLRVFPNALSECREANIRFNETVKTCLKTPS